MNDLTPGKSIEESMLFPGFISLKLQQDTGSMPGLVPMLKKFFGRFLQIVTPGFLKPTFHYIVCEEDFLSLYLLLFYHSVSSFFKKASCSDRSVCSDFGRSCRLL